MMKKIILILITVIIFSSCVRDREYITIASKKFTENVLLAEIIKTIIESHTDIEVKIIPGFGSTFILQAALQSGEIDIYPEYTGTIYQNILKKKDNPNEPTMLSIIQEEMDTKYDIIALNPFGFNNTYAMGLLREHAHVLGLTYVSDLASYPFLVAGFDEEFVNRQDGGKKMLETYNIALDTDIVSLSIAERYDAMINGQVDFIDVFTTDAELKLYNITILEDDLEFFPKYHALPLVRKEILETYPSLTPLLILLSNTINEEEMIEMNFEVDKNKKSQKEVARSFLREKELI